MFKGARPLMVRRDFIAGLLSAAGIKAARAQRSAKVHRIALVDPVFPTVEMTESASPIARAFYEELRRLGYVEGGNLQIERYSAGEAAEHHPELARDVVRRNPDLIFVFGHRILLDFKAATCGAQNGRPRALRLTIAALGTLLMPGIGRRGGCFAFSSGLFRRL